MFGSYLSVGEVGKRKRIIDGYSEQPDKETREDSACKVREVRLYQMSP
jgi:hypothetical protein